MEINMYRYPSVISFFIVAQFLLVFSAPSQPVLLQNPPILQSTNGYLQVTLNASVFTASVLGETITVDCFNGTQLPPTLKLSPGDTLHFIIINNLPQNATTNVHFHGMYVTPVPPGDNVLFVLENGARYEYLFTLPTTHPRGLYWYHSHDFVNSTYQTRSGLAGLIIVEGILNPFPELEGIKEYHFLLRDEQIANGTISREIPDQQYRVVNNFFQPMIEMRPNEMQLWRFCNAGPNTYENLTMNGTTWNIIANDGKLLNRILKHEALFIPPSSRRELLMVAPSEPGVYPVYTVNVDTGPDGGTNYTDQVYFYVNVTGGPAESRTLPTVFPEVKDWRNNEISRRRKIVYSENQTAGHTEFYIDGRQFSPNRVDTISVANTTEEWTIINTAAEIHTFHIHQTHFQVVSVNGEPQPFYGQIDNVNVPYATSDRPGEVVVLINFPTNSVGSFVYHCHLLRHEDHGMMAVITVLPPGSKIPQGAGGEQPPPFGEHTH